MISLYDENTIQKYLHNDINTLVKNIKIRQERYYKLLDINQSIFINFKSILNDHTIINFDQVPTHRITFNQFKSHHLDTQSEQLLICKRYKGVYAIQQPTIRLLVRVGSRILQMMESYYEKIKIFDHNIEEKYKKMKNSLKRTLNSKEKVNIGNFFSIIIQYMHYKINEQLNNMDQLIDDIQSGDPLKFRSLCQADSLKKWFPYQKQIYNQSHIQNKMENTKNIQIKQFISDEDMKKQKIKFINNLVDIIYKPMQLSKIHIIQDIICLNPKQKCKKLYDEIYSRNKFNHDQIVNFQTRNEESRQKITELQSKKQIENAQYSTVINNLQKKVISFPVIQLGSQIQGINGRLKHQNQFINRDDNNQVKFGRTFDLKSNQNLQTKNKQTIQTIVKNNSSNKDKQSLPFFSVQTFQQIQLDSKKQKVCQQGNRTRLPIIKNKSSMSRYENQHLSTNDLKRINIAIPIHMNGHIINFQRELEKLRLKKSIQCRKKLSLPK